MTPTFDHLNWLVPVTNSLKTSCDREVQIFDFVPNFNDKTIFASWAKHFRNHYCLDTEIDILRNGTGLSKAAYLHSIRFPDESVKPGPGIRSGDFAEILLSDFVQFVLKFWVPRTRYANKSVRNKSTKDTDILGFQFIKDVSNPSPKDTLLLFEIKAQLSKGQPKARLQDAIDDSIKDNLRKAESLNAIKQRLLDKNQNSDVSTVSRFQNHIGNPYLHRYGAVAVIDASLQNPEIITKASAKLHPDQKNILLIIIVINDAMKLVNHLYTTAADEA